MGWNIEDALKGIGLDKGSIDNLSQMAGMLILSGFGGENSENEEVASEENIVIGKVADLNKLEEGEQTLDLPNLNNPKLNWKQNSSKLREAMNNEVPIRDASVDPKTGAIINNTGFLKAERNLLTEHNWTYNSNTHYWSPPTTGVR